MCIRGPDTYNEIMHTYRKSKVSHDEEKFSQLGSLCTGQTYVIHAFIYVIVFYLFNWSANFLCLSCIFGSETFLFYLYLQPLQLLQTFFNAF